MLTIAGREASSEVSRSPPDIHAYATHKLLKAIRDDDGSQRGLLVVGIWCIGEYGDLLLNPYTYTPSPGAGELANGAPVSITFMALDPFSVVKAMETVVNRHSCPEYVKERALTAFAKLSDRFADKGDAAALSLLQSLLKKHEISHSLELQLRACEYEALVNATKGVKTVVAKPSAEADLFGVTDNGGGEGVSASVMNAAKEALSRMPVVDLKVLEKKREDAFGDAPMPAAFAASAPAAPAQTGGGGYDPFGATAPQQMGAPAAAANPLDIFGAPPAASAPAPVPPAAAANPLDIFGAPPAQTTPPAPMATPAAAPAAPMMGAAAPPPNAGSVVVPAFTHEGLTIEFECTKPDIWNKQVSELVAKCKNGSPDAMYGFNLQCAVPKYVTMEMEPPSSTTIPVTGMNTSKIVTQKIKVTNSQLGTKNLMLKLKVSFTLQGRKVEHMATCGGFPAGEY
eukprot:CAMPEP_0178812060 /NCGR_PEP_ID=MMETSP0745-20121128/19625_1 /TAXON_ID=913974 /ORGANISM="Nitzschia punctata, Strain CCMP561" /LENGTH=454 /DNA_ID=CAMNT_0020472829 /DNA_START=61 /DNA_END=1426 /DNA_ORIENTATION=-